MGRGKEEKGGKGAGMNLSNGDGIHLEDLKVSGLLSHGELVLLSKDDGVGTGGDSDLGSGGVLSREDLTVPDEGVQDVVTVLIGQGLTTGLTKVDITNEASLASWKRTSALGVWEPKREI